ncbi:hypothetical protein [Cytobacillus praedii]|uniref:hypothetical protein n=1 Tax=Cytobacillus praedii TaxID=1742358 RepID=UPI002E1F2CCC|nr:hypothetical protein [Cytobacillus praedii]
MNTKTDNNINPFNRVLNEFIQVKEEIGKIPTTTFLKENGYHKLLHYIDKCGGIYSVYTALNIVPPRKPRSFWDDFENVKTQFEKVWRETGKFPTYHLIKEKKVSGLVDAIKKHGGMKRLRNLYNSPVVKIGREKKWDDYDKIVNLFRNLISELGRFPTKEDLINRGISGVINSILNHGGFYRLYESLGVEPKVKPNGYWNDIKNICYEIDIIIEKTGTFPSLEKLKTMGLSSMATAITKKHGGMVEIRKKYNAPLNTVEPGYYSDFNKVCEVIERFRKTMNHFPTISELEEYKPGIKAAILKYHNNYLEVRKKLNEPIIQKEPGYWKDLPKVESALMDLEEQLGAFPTQAQIDNFGELGLYQGIIKYHEGLTRVRERLGIKPKKMSNLEIRYKAFLNAYVDDEVYYDNRKKILNQFFNIKLFHPISGNFLELDRYYPNYQVAIEIQGDQHNKEIKFFADRKKKTTKEYLEEIKMVDAFKKEQCEAQNIVLIELVDGMTKEELLRKVGRYLPIRKEPLKMSSKHYYRSLEEEIIEKLQNLQSHKESFVTKNDVVEFSRPLYDDIRLLYGGIYNAREAAGILQPLKKR